MIQTDIDSNLVQAFILRGLDDKKSVQDWLSKKYNKPVLGDQNQNRSTFFVLKLLPENFLFLYTQKFLLTCLVYKLHIAIALLHIRHQYRAKKEGPKSPIASL